VEKSVVARFLRRGTIGILAGAISSVALVFTLGRPGWSLVCGAAVGALYSAGLPPTRGTYVDNLMAGGAFGIPLWALISVIAIPLATGSMPEWSAEAMRAHFPSLVGWVLYGASLGVLLQGLNDVVQALVGPEPKVEAPPSGKTPRIVILGGGFAGMRTAEYLERELGGDVNASITLVSESNALLFTPMLAEVAGGSVEPSHISTPLRTSLRRTEFLRASAKEIDLERRCVTLEGPRDGDPQALREVPFDHLVVALGAVSNYRGLANVERLAFDFKSLLDAIRIRNRVIETFERADREADPALRRRLLTYVVAGGGFAGVELAGALNDFSHGILADYPNLSRDDLSVVLVHSQDRILPELSDSLARYAQERMEARGVRFRLKTRLADARPGSIVLSDGEIPAETLVWTAGTAPNPLLKTLPVEKDPRGAIVVDRALAVPGHSGLWAIGDCAAVKDAKTGKPCPPTAQFALREAEVLAKNLLAELKGRPLRAFHFDSLGALCVVGYQTACAELTLPFARERSLRFSGLLAWLLWRGIYLSKLPGIERKIRVLTDWVVELFFPRDIVQTIDLS
jgi:NADH dehydrogenase